jgi:hypothetical protein
MRQNLAEQSLNYKPLDSIAVGDDTTSAKESLDIVRVEQLREAVLNLERTASGQRVTLFEYRTVETVAAEFFADLLRGLPFNLAREAQSAMSNALFSLELTEPKPQS